MRTLFILSWCVFIALFAVNSYSESEPICCTWVNFEYVEGARPQKLILNYDGTFQTYKTHQSLEPIQHGTFQIVKKWKDSQDNIWYKMDIFDKSGKKYKLAKISQNGKKLEFICNSENFFPAGMNKADANYCNYIRASMK